MIQFKKHMPLALIIIIYMVGLIGISMEEWRSQFLALTALNLMFSFVWLIWQQKLPLRQWILPSVIIAAAGFLIEVLGVHTGVLFGSYQYGETLGLKLFAVPLIIGVNWLLLVISTHGISHRFLKSSWQVALVAAGLMTTLDVLIEPVAIQLDYWHWLGESIPVQNYIMWFITATVFHLIFGLFKLRLNFKACVVIYAVQLLFFAFLNLYL